MELPYQVETALQELTQAGFSAYLVGGCVRDALMGLQPKDYDITTAALPEQTKQVFCGYRVIETGLQHGTVTVLLDGMPLEITTYRVDGTYRDCRHPDSVSFSDSLKDDLSRRDFTVNAIAYHPKQGLVDCFGGRQDIFDGMIRCIGLPEQRFHEDALRILRALRFSSVLGFTIEEKTAKAIHREKGLLRHVSAERIYTEFVKLLCGKNVRPVLEDYIDVIAEFLPQALAMKGCLQNCVYHCFDVLGHTARAVEAIEPEPVLRLAAFFHDIGKPACRTTDENGIDHFYGHGAVSAEIAHTALVQLRSDSKTVQLVTELVQHHDVPIAQTEKSIKRSLNRLSADGFFQMLALKRADTLAHSRMCHDRLEELTVLQNAALQILEKQDCFSLKQLAINGRDLLAEGIPAGKRLGALLQMLLDAVIDGRVENEKAALLEYLLQNTE